VLERSLDLLYKNYNERFRHDVLIFHEGDFKESDQREVARGRKEISFRTIRFDLPSFLDKDEVPTIWSDGCGNHYGMGHRHMIRFYAVQVFNILHDMGYDWFFRMDDDSFIHSRIDYDLFEFMERNSYEYGYRVDFKDAETVARGFGDAVLAYLKAEEIQPTFLGEHLTPVNPGLRLQVKNLANTLVMRAFPQKRRQLAPHPLQYDLWGYYNNFFITKVAFWYRPDVRLFIRHFDRIGGWYKYRWNDLIFQSAAVQTFMPKAKVYKFTDWTYEHATIKDGKILCGGIYEGTNDKDSAAVSRFKALYGVTVDWKSCPSF
jgi:alpha 1,2-mannosyltransferase